MSGSTNDYRQAVPMGNSGIVRNGPGSLVGFYKSNQGSGQLIFSLYDGTDATGQIILLPSYVSQYGYDACPCVFKNGLYVLMNIPAGITFFT